MSWKPEVQTETDGRWSSNSLRFATYEEAEGYVQNLYARWTLVRETRVVECDDAVTSTWPTDQPVTQPLPRAPEDQGLSVEVIKPGDIGRLLDELSRNHAKHGF